MKGKADVMRCNASKMNIANPLQCRVTAHALISWPLKDFLCVFWVSFLRGKRVTTLSNRRETRAQFTTHGTLSKSGLPNRTWQRFRVLLRPTR